MNPVTAALDAAYAGKLASAFCSTVIDALESFAAEPLPDPVDEFDEAAAARYLAEGNGSYSLCEPPLTGAELVGVRQLIEERFGSPTSADGAVRTARDPAAEDAPHRQDISPSGGAGHPHSSHQ